MTPTVTTISTLARNDGAIIASDGRLIGGSVISSAPAGPAPIPSESIACTIGTSPAVGITKRVPASAKIAIHQSVLPISGPICGKSHARVAPRNRTRTQAPDGSSFGLGS